MAQVKVRLCDTVVTERIGEELILLNTDTGDYYCLNSSAADMIEAINDSETLDDAVVQIVNQYDAPVEQVHEDLHKLVQTLVLEEMATEYPA